MFAILAEIDDPPLPPSDLPVVDDDRSWFWYTLDRWPDPGVTNGPRMTCPQAVGAYRALRTAKKGNGPLRRVLLKVYVRNREVLGADVATSCGDRVLDELARRLYPWATTRDTEGCLAFEVSVYGRELPAESSFDMDFL
ncbi:MAG: hypothetical protein H6735_12120 [Alphaproteobacteria bacterium]|nr:hypothetical protein [Alphaproteobacteria bacterium]